ncbi:MAG: CapA family protein [Oscillospiraceae bacterium]|nr:CapA family protein [Oscillospiraceae bacterium]
MKNKRTLIKALSALLCAALLTSCTSIADTPQESDSEGSTTPEETTAGSASETTEEAPPAPLEKLSVHLVCAGDNLIHSNIYNQARNRAGGEGYDFSYVYERVIPYITDADFAILNQETLVTDAYPPSNYPMFCTPQALGDYMVEVMGFDAVSMSNNHVLDQGESGLIASLDYWDTEHPDIVRYGAYRSEEDMNDIRIKEVNGITFAFLGYMEHTNGLVNPGKLGTRVIYLNELELIEQQIKRARELADVVVVSPHFGIEVTNVVTDSQRELSRLFVEWGADLIIGTQPHTIQECEWIEREDGTRGFVYYCLGNFVSSMDVSISMVGGIGDLQIEMDPVTREITIIEPKLIPIITHYDAGFQNVRIYPYAQYTAELAAVHGCGISMGLLESVIDYVPEEFLAIV